MQVHPAENFKSKDHPRLLLHSTTQCGAEVSIGNQTKKNQAMQAHQQRVIDEKTELDKKAIALNEFICNSPIFPTIDPEEQERMKDQRKLMSLYSAVLGRRIAAFKD